MKTLTYTYHTRHPDGYSPPLGTPAPTDPLRRRGHETGDAELIYRQGQVVACAAHAPVRLHGCAYALLCREPLARTGWQSATAVALTGGRV
jgi:hypothetical protein